MIGLIDRHRDALRQLCERYAVTRLELFGSATGDRFDPAKSDLDFLVDFGEHSTMNLFVRYFDFEEALETLFGYSVDLVMVGALKNPYFIEGVNESRVLVYAA